jgi:hypothetical protein
MGWSIGYDNTWKRDIGYGVPAYCDHPGCNEEIDRGLAYVCGDGPYGGEHGCGLYVCGKHQFSNAACSQLCQHCSDRRRKRLTPAPEHPKWLRFKLRDPSWKQWREENPQEVAAIRERLRDLKGANDDSR